MSDAFLLLSYGSPELRRDVVPYLENILAGKRIPKEVLEKAAKQYDEVAIQTGQFSPLADECLGLISAFLDDQNRNQSNNSTNSANPVNSTNSTNFPVYWANLYWYPFVKETLLEMKEQGIDRAFALITAPFESESGRQRYTLAIEKARSEIGPDAPQIVPLPAFGPHPLYVRAVADRILTAAAHLSLELDYSLSAAGTRILFTAHSIPVSDSECAVYVGQFQRTCEAVVQLLYQPELTHRQTETETERPATQWDKPPQWEPVFQSRSGSPNDPWLEPDISDRITRLAQYRNESGQELTLIIVPIGFLLENKETVYDLDLNAMGLCEELGIRAVRAATAGSGPPVIQMIRELLSAESVVDSRGTKKV